MIKNPTIGCDFEVFLFDISQSRVINAKPYVRGSKTEPFNFDTSNKFWCTSLDNISFEGNIAPCTTPEDFDKGIDKVLNYLKEGLPEFIIPYHQCAVRVDPSELNTEEAMTFGCEPSYNAYTLAENPQPDSFTDLRTCCTHIHVKYEKMNIRTSAELIKAMDLFLGMPSIIIEPANERRLLYGTLGEMRFHPKKTTEYRVLSSFFSETSERRKWAFNNTSKAIEWVNAGNRVSDQMAEEFQAAMASSDIQYVKKLVETYNIPLPQ